MPKTITFASCAFFGFRPDRDTGRYYRLLLNDLAAKKGDAQLVVATNDPTGFDSTISLVETQDIEPWRERLWADPNYQQEYARRLAWHPRNLGLGQSKYPHMVGVYLAKTAIMLDLAIKLDGVIWLDAGLLFSVLHDHGVPELWTGYSLEKLTLEAKAFENENRAQFATIPRKWRFLKNHRPNFHGLSFNDMSRLAAACSVTPGDTYTVAGAVWLPRSAAETIQSEFGQVWQTMLDQGRAGTEETVLSVLRWRHGWATKPIETWVQDLT